MIKSWKSSFLVLVILRSQEQGLFLRLIFDAYKGDKVSEIKYDVETGEIIEKDKKIKFKHTKQSTVDPDAGFYHKGEHEKQFAYSASAFCDRNGYVLDIYVTSGNIHDSISFAGLYNNFKNNFLFNKTKLVCLDNGYTSPAVAKTIIDSGKHKELLKINKEYKKLCETEIIEK